MENNMSDFKTYLAESVKTYEFKIKIAGEVPSNIVEQMKSHLMKYECAELSKGTRTPIQEAPLDFPDMKNTHVNIYNVKCMYPVTSHELVNYLSERLKITASCIRVRSNLEDQELAMNAQAHQRIGKSGETLLATPYETTDNQNLVGEKAKLSFLQELNKVKHDGVKYTGINDALLAKDSPKESPDTSTPNVNNVSIIGSKKTSTKFVDPFKG
jgi:hypothetical protein